MKQDYPIAFEEAWREFPRREPDNPKKPAWKAWQSRVNEGEKIGDLLAATKGYAASIRQRRLEGTDRVLQAATFYGPNERWQEFMPKPAAPAIAKPKLAAEPPEERVDARPFLRELMAKLASGVRSI